MLQVDRPALYVYLILVTAIGGRRKIYFLPERLTCSC